MTNAQHAAEGYVPAPEQRFSMPKVAPDFYRAMVELERAAHTGVDPTLAELVRLHASMINGCAFCLDMHAVEARELGIPDHRVYSLPVWRETPYYTARERAALALTEAVTKVSEGQVPDAVYDEAARHFDQEELARLVALIIAINSWNRIQVTTRTPPADRQG